MNKAATRRELLVGAAAVVAAASVPLPAQAAVKPHWLVISEAEIAAMPALPAFYSWFDAITMIDDALEKGGLDGARYGAYDQRAFAWCLQDGQAYLSTDGKLLPTERGRRLAYLEWLDSFDFD